MSPEVKCTDPDYQLTLYYVWALSLVVPLGMPLWYYRLLRSQKEKLVPKPPYPHDRARSAEIFKDRIKQAYAEAEKDSDSQKDLLHHVEKVLCGKVTFTLPRAGSYYSVQMDSTRRRSLGRRRSAIAGADWAPARQVLKNGESKRRSPLTNTEFHTKLDKAYDSVVQDSGTEVGIQWLQVSRDLSALSFRSV